MSDVTRSAGWYPDPDGKPGERWWNGAGWSDARRGATPAVTPQPMPVPEQAPPTPVIYSAANPAPQAPNAYGPPGAVVVPRSAVTINARINPMAFNGLVAGIVAMLFNVLLVPSILAIVFSVKGLAKARELSAAGQTTTLRTLAIIGLVLGIFSAIGGIIQGAIFVGTIVSGFVIST